MIILLDGEFFSLLLRWGALIVKGSLSTTMSFLFFTCAGKFIHSFWHVPISPPFDWASEQNFDRIIKTCMKHYKKAIR